MIMFRQIGWWYWFVTAGLLAAGLSGWFVAFYLAIALCVVQVVHFAMSERSVSALCLNGESL